MLKKILGIVFLVSGVWGLVSSASAQTESITFTTYYPSPYGVYRRLRVQPSAPDPGEGPTTPCTNPGELYFDSTTNNLYICSGSPSTWVAVGGGAGGSYWAASPANPNNIYNTNSGNVGIGTTSPSGKIHIMSYWGGPVIQDDRTVILQASEATGDGLNNSPGIRLHDSGGSAKGGLGLSGRTNAWSNGSQPGDTVLRAINGGNLILATAPDPTTSANINPRLYITNTGNVGIGTTTPGAKLEVAGQVKITGGTPGAGKVLTSDANGLASWQAAGGGGAQFGGMFSKCCPKVNVCVVPNPVTGSCTCPAGFITVALADYLQGSQSGLPACGPGPCMNVGQGFFCYKP
jgi:hypothetical protein